MVDQAEQMAPYIGQIIGAVAVAWLALTAVMMVNPVVLAVTALVIGGALIAKHWRGIAGVVIGAFDAVKGVVMGVVEWIEKAIASAGRLYDKVSKNPIVKRKRRSVSTVCSPTSAPVTVLISPAGMSTRQPFSNRACAISTEFVT